MFLNIQNILAERRSFVAANLKLGSEELYLNWPTRDYQIAKKLFECRPNTCQMNYRFMRRLSVATVAQSASGVLR
jgi:hypothetical protein